MKWFKHYTNASQGAILQKLETKYGRVRAYGMYFLLVEYFALKWDGKSDLTLEVSAQSLANHLQVKQKSCISLLELLQVFEGLTFVEHQNVLKINFPKLLELQHRDAFPAGIRPELGRKKTGLDKNRLDKNRLDINTLVELNSTFEPHDLIKIWNEHCGSLPKCIKSTTRRDEKIKKIWPQQNSDGWIETVKKISTSNFCNGKGPTGWRATFDWILQPDVWLKVNEGKYENSEVKKRNWYG